MSAEDSSYRRGDVVAGRYRVEGRLGEGGMGEVYEALQLDLNRLVALKVLRPRFGVDSDARKRFVREARVAAALNHPNAVTIYDFGQDQPRSRDAGGEGERLYLTMERLRGETLREALERRSDCGLEPDTTIEVGVQVADVLVAAHAIGLVHRDLKAENIFLEPTGMEKPRVVVVDFGLAFIENAEAVGRLTREGVVAGTPEYMSPEQVRGRRVGPPADIYALGCLLFELATGDIPFRGESAFETASLHVYMPAPSIAERCPESPLRGEFEELVGAMLAKSPDDRPTAEDVAQRLRALQGRRNGRETRRDGDAGCSTREARMVPPAPMAKQAETMLAEAGTDRALVSAWGELDEELRRGMASAGLVVVPGPVEGEEARVLLGASLDQVREQVGRGLPVICDAEAGDFDRLSALIELGVDEVVPSPVHVEELTKRVWRALRRARRRRQKKA